MSADLYRPAVVKAWKNANSRHNLSQWVQIVGRRLQQFQNDEDIYAPIPLNVKIAGTIHDTDGNVTITVAPTDSEWYPKLVDALERMTKQKGLTVTDYLGDSIKSMTPLQLSNAGELDIVKSGRVVRLNSAVPPPLDMATDKDRRLAKWWTSIRDDLAERVAISLKDQTFLGVSGAVQRNGVVQELIASYLKSHTPDGMSWEDFVKTYGSDNVAKKMNPDDNLEFVSQGLLHVIRTALTQNEKQVRDHYSTQGISSDAGLWKTAPRTGVSKYQDTFTMYRDFIEDAMYLPIVGQHMVDTMLHGWTRVSPLTKLRETRKVQVRPKVISDFHPLATYYNQVHYPKHKQMPGHVMEQFTTNSSVATAKEFKGNAVEAMRIYHMLCGRCPTVTERVSSAMPISSAMPDLVPISSAMPDLVPISSAMPDLVPISSAMPNLVPIESVYGNLGEPIWQSESDMPSLDDYM